MFGAKRPRLEKSLSICILFDMDFVIIQDSIHGGSLKVYYSNSWLFILSWHTWAQHRTRFTRGKNDAKLTQNFYEKKKLFINLRILELWKGKGIGSTFINFYRNIHSVRFSYKFNMLQPPQKKTHPTPPHPQKRTNL